MPERSAPAIDPEMTVYVGIGNSDDKLTQFEWAAFVADLRSIASGFATQLLGEWFSLPDKQWQNCEIAWTMPAQRLAWLRQDLGDLRAKFRQDSIALAIVDRTEFI